MDKDEALKLALEALDNLLYWDNGKPEYDEAREAITACQQALTAQPAPVQEPVALEEYDAGLLNDYGGGNVEWWQDYIRAELGRAYEHYQSQIAAPPAQPAPVQEPVVWISAVTGDLTMQDMSHTVSWAPLYTTPPAAQQEPVADEAKAAKAA